MAMLCIAIHITSTAQKKNVQTLSFKVLGTCIQCKNRIENTAKNLGIYKANWVIETSLLTVSFDSSKLSKEMIRQSLAAAGHDNDGFLATNEAYENLPKCCYYKRDDMSPAENGQHTITGIVLEEDKNGKLHPLPGAGIRSLDANIGVTADSLGVFQLLANIPAKFEVSNIGFKKDTITISSASEIKVILKNSSTSNLSEVVVRARNQSTYVSSLSTFNTLNIGSVELAKAACCNLSESFETSPSVDVNYADAVTGIKQIQLLGLSGNYTQLLTENTPEIKGLAGSFGLTFIPGPWLEGIQVTKGAGSVANGYESIAGQINIDEKKPDKMDKLFVNAYANNLGRMEATVNVSQKLSDNWSTALLTHANAVTTKKDNNGDGFIDLPIGRQFNIINRWKYADTKGVFAQFAIKALNDRRQSGETGFDPAADKLTTNKYGVGIDVQQYAFTGKLGYVFPSQKYKSIGFIFSANAYNNNAYYGLTKYDGQQNSVYANLIYQSIIGTTAHKFRTGLSFVNDHYKETIAAKNYTRKEIVPGSFFEYTYTAPKNFSAVAGLRLDYHNEYGWVTTPRLHLKYDFTPTTNLRLSGGSGFRTANIFAENTGLLVSSRQYSIMQPSRQYGYGLDPEKAWNFGLNFIHHFTLNKHKGTIGLDLYRTSFRNQVVVDVDANPQQIIFSNLKGKSFSNSFQAELNYELVKKLDLRLAYRWLDVKTNYSGLFLAKPLVAKHRAFVNLAYQTNNKWKFDLTTQWISRKRLPGTSANPADLQMPAYSPSFIQMSAQITRVIGARWELYLGAENLTGYTQGNLFISGDQPFSKYFDGSLVWGPVNGRIIYSGLRYKLQ